MFYLLILKVFVYISLIVILFFKILTKVNNYFPLVDPVSQKTLLFLFELLKKWQGAKVVERFLGIKGVV